MDHVNPQGSRELSGRLLEVACVASEYPSGLLPLRHHLAMRNRIIAELCMTTVVIEAPERSGTPVVADCVMYEGREVLADEDPLSSVRFVDECPLNTQGAARVTSVAELRQYAGAVLADAGSAGREASGACLERAATRDWRHVGEWLVGGLRRKRITHFTRRGQ